MERRMSVAAQQISEVAQFIIDRAQARAEAIQQERRQLKTGKSAFKAEIHSAKLSLKRTHNFQMRAGSHYQCPRCWVDEGKRSALRLVRGLSGGDALNALCAGS